jgi:hypothetical protein
VGSHVGADELRIRSPRPWQIVFPIGKHLVDCRYFSKEAVFVVGIGGPAEQPSHDGRQDAAYLNQMGKNNQLDRGFRVAGSSCSNDPRSRHRNTVHVAVSVVDDGDSTELEGQLPSDVSVRTEPKAGRVGSEYLSRQ